MSSDVEQINQTLFQEMPNFQTEAALVIGHGAASSDIARHTAKLYKAGAFSRIFIAGGNPNRQLGLFLGLLFSGQWDALKGRVMDFLSGDTEAGRIYKILKEEGVDVNLAVSMVDNEAKTVQGAVENVERRILSNRQFRSVSLVTYATDQVYAVGSFRARHNLNGINVVARPFFAFGKNAGNWDQGENRLDAYVQREVRSAFATAQELGEYPTTKHRTAIRPNFAAETKRLEDAKVPKFPALRY